MHTDEELLEFVLEKCSKLGITGYDIGKNTSISEQSAYKILDGSTKKPRRRTLLEIRDFLEKRNTGTNLKNEQSHVSMIEEPTTGYESGNIYLENNKLHKIIQKLIVEIYGMEQLLREHKIPHKSIMENKDLFT